MALSNATVQRCNVAANPQSHRPDLRMTEQREEAKYCHDLARHGKLTKEFEATLAPKGHHATFLKLLILEAQRSHMATYGVALPKWYLAVLMEVMADYDANPQDQYVAVMKLLHNERLFHVDRIATLHGYNGEEAGNASRAFLNKAAAVAPSARHYTLTL
jgi:hypothetical protein